MKTLDELPHRFWPESELPEGMEVSPKHLNLKPGKFAKIYAKQVDPALRELGFECKAMRGRGRRDDFITLSWFVADKDSGSGYLSFAAHPIQLPTRNDEMLGPASEDFLHSIFRLDLQLLEPRRDAHRFDLGKDETEAAQTCALLCELIAEQAAPFLDGLPSAMSELRTVSPANLESRMPELMRRHHLCVTANTPVLSANDQILLALLLGRLAVLDGRSSDATAWATLGLELLPIAFAHFPHPRLRFAILFEKLGAGSPELHFSARDGIEHRKRLAAERAG